MRVIFEVNHDRNQIHDSSAVRGVHISLMLFMGGAYAVSNQPSTSDTRATRKKFTFNLYYYEQLEHIELNNDVKWATMGIPMFCLRMSSKECGRISKALPFYGLEIGNDPQPQTFPTTNANHLTEHTLVPINIYHK